MLGLGYASVQYCRIKSIKHAEMSFGGQKDKTVSAIRQASARNLFWTGADHRLASNN
jgi:hypothetical protein